MLYFANVAVHANADYQVIFPPSTEFGTQHGKREFVHWPIGHETLRRAGPPRRGPELVEEPPHAGLHFRLELRG